MFAFSLILSVALIGVYADTAAPKTEVEVKNTVQPKSAASLDEQNRIRTRNLLGLLRPVNGHSPSRTYQELPYSSYQQYMVAAPHAAPVVSAPVHLAPANLAPVHLTSAPVHSASMASMVSQAYVKPDVVKKPTSAVSYVPYDYSSIGSYGSLGSYGRGYGSGYGSGYGNGYGIGYGTGYGSGYGSYGYRNSFNGLGTSGNDDVADIYMEPSSSTAESKNRDLIVPNSRIANQQMPPTHSSSSIFTPSMNWDDYYQPAKSTQDGNDSQQPSQEMILPQDPEDIVIPKFAEKLLNNPEFQRIVSREYEKAKKEARSVVEESRVDDILKSLTTDEVKTLANKMKEVMAKLDKESSSTTPAPQPAADVKPEPSKA